MNLFDIIGPVMVGPSSSHTAGAARIGLVARRLLGEDVSEAEILFHGSFLATGKGHGTDRALVGGLMGFAVDDARIPDSLSIAEKRGMHLRFGAIDLGPDANPNSVKLNLLGKSGKTLELIASSVGGGRIQIERIDGLKAVFSGDRPTLIVQNDDTPGKIAAVALMMLTYSINIATMELDRDNRGGHAVTVLELDQEIPEEALRALSQQPGILKVTYLSLIDQKGDEQKHV